MGADALWITFAENRLWWARARPGVEWRDDLDGRLPRRRATLEGWRSDDLRGAPLLLRNLSTRLTRIGAFRGAICKVGESEYLLRRIEGDAEPLVLEAESTHKKLQDVTHRLIQRLDPTEFEILVDLIFRASGWTRVSVLGGTEQDVDLVVEQVATGERAFVQVKSEATPAVLQRYVNLFKQHTDCSRMFFACHSPKDGLEAIEAPPGVDLWLLETVASKALRSGLFDWLIERAR